jgi:hypothetical protein
MPDWVACALAWTDLHPGAAAWGQAIFSIVAIAIAILVPWRQHVRDVKLSQQLRVEDRMRSMEAAAEIVINAMNLIEDAWKGTERPGDTLGYIHMAHDPSAFDFAARALEQINLASVPDWQLIRPIIGMRKLVLKAKDLPSAIHDADEMGLRPADELRGELHDLREEANQHTSAVEAMVNQLRNGSPR